MPFYSYCSALSNRLIYATSLMALFLDVGEDAVFTAWHPGRPNGVEQNCAATDNHGEWNDVSCTAFFPAVCYIGK